MHMWSQAYDTLAEAERQLEKESSGISGSERLTVALVEALLAVSQELSLIHNEGIDVESRPPEV
jgi:hypothetical protein